MATYIPGLTDQVPVIQPFQPDFGMVQKALTTLQSKYDQGFASVQNAYNQVLNAPLTNPTLKQYRDDYVKDSEKKLKDLSSVDLSLYENQAAAENVFAPFWKDERFLTDTYLTKNIQSEIQKGFDARDSKDENIRSQYNPLSTDYLQNGLEELRDADPNSPNFAKIQPRRWVPFKDLEGYLEEEANKKDLHIEWTSPSGPYLVTTRNGERATTSFKTWAHNMLGNKFTDQFQVMGTMEKENDIKMLMRSKPGITKDQATAMLAPNIMDTMDKGYKDRNDLLQEDMGKLDAQINWYRGKILTPQQDADFTKLVMDKIALTEQQTNAADEYKKFTKNHDATLNTIVQSPDQYLASINKQRVIDGWAAARASNQSQEWKLDPALHEQNDVFYKRAELEAKAEDLRRKDRDLDAHMVDTDGDGKPDRYVSGSGRSTGGGGGGGYGYGTSGGGGYGYGTGSPGVEGGFVGTDNTGSSKSVQTISSGHVLGKGITDISQTGTAYDVLRNEQDNRLNVAHSNLFDLEGLTHVLTAKLLVDKTLARNYVNELQRLIEDPDKEKMDNTGGNNSKIEAQIEKESGVKIVGPISARNALTTLAGQYLQEKYQKGASLMDEGDRTMVRKYMVGMYALHQYESTEKIIQERVQNVFNTSHDYDIMRQDHGGKPGLITSFDVARNLPQKEYDLGEGSMNDPAKAQNDPSHGTKLTAEKIARYYMQGKISEHSDQDGMFAVKFGDDYTIIKDNFTKSPSDELYHDLSILDSKYGSSQAFKEKMDGLTKKIMPAMGDYQNKTGRYGYPVEYHLNPNENDKFTVDLLNEVSNPDNRVAIYDGKDRSESTDLNAAVLDLLGRSQSGMDKIISSVVVNNFGPNGNPIVHLNFNSFDDNDKLNIKGVLVKDLAKKDISIELDPHGSGKTINSLRVNPEFYIYGDLLRGKPIEADPVLKAIGFDCSILPNNSKNPTYAQFSLKRTLPDSTTGDRKPFQEKNYKISFDTMTPDEIMNMYYDLLEQHLKEIADISKVQQDKLPAGSKTGQQRYDEIMNSRPPVN